MLRTVSTHIELGLTGSSTLVFSVAAAQGSPIRDESLLISVDGRRVEPREIIDVHGSRLHTLQASGSRSSSTTAPRSTGWPNRRRSTEIDEIVYAPTEPLLRVRLASPRPRPPSSPA